MSKPTTSSAPFGVALTIAILMHAALLVLLAYSVDFHAKPKPQPQSAAPVVKATVVDQATVKQHVERIKQKEAEARRAEQRRQDELKRQMAEAERKRKAEQDKIKALEQKQKQKQAEIKKAEEAAKQAKLKLQQEQEQARKAAEQRKREEQARQKAEAERKAAEEAARKAEAERKRKDKERQRLEAERKQKAEAERARKAREAELAKQMAAEQAELEAARNTQVLSEVDRYSVLIRQAIQRNLRTNNTMRGKSCRIRIDLAPDGFVFDSQILGGDDAVCRATKAAIQSAGKLPVSQEPDVYQRLKQIDLTVEPEL